MALGANLMCTIPLQKPKLYIQPAAGDRCSGGMPASAHSKTQSMLSAAFLFHATTGLCRTVPLAIKQNLAHQDIERCSFS